MFGRNKSVLSASKELYKYVEEEIESIENCTKCYSLFHASGEKSIVMSCGTKHPVIWAQSEGFDYWPAKALLYDGNARIVHVRYFDGSLDKVKLENCYHFSQQAPKEINTKDELIKNALRVC